MHDRRGGRLTAAMLDAGVEPLRRLLDVLPGLRVVVLHGGHARDGWARLLRAHGDVVEARGLVALPTWHPSNQVFAVPPPLRAEREREVVDAYAQATSLCSHEFRLRAAT